MTQADMDALLLVITAAVAIVATGISAAAAAKIGPKVAKWGYGQIMGWFR